MIRDRFGRLRGWINSQSTIGRIVVLVGAVVLFLIAQQFAMVSNSAARGTPTMMLGGLVGIVLAIVAIYSVYAVLRSFIGSGGGSTAEA